VDGGRHPVVDNRAISVDIGRWMWKNLADCDETVT
jgi:hypothetical protein